jgi:hypothetical protein
MPGALAALSLSAQIFPKVKLEAGHFLKCLVTVGGSPIRFLHFIGREGKAFRRLPLLLLLLPFHLLLYLILLLSLLSSSSKKRKSQG